jgi:uncharacterized membrane protein
MISRYAWYLRELLKKVWVRVVSFALLAILSVALARVLAPFVPEEFALQTGSEAVAQLLGVLTSSMLAVTTFSLSIAVSAFAAAAGTATPRATVLLQEDDTTQNVLATFLGAFLFGLLGLIALNANLYDASGKVVVFIFTIAVIGLVVLALIRWIDHLMDFGRMDDTLDRVEAAATLALDQRLSNPYLGGRPLIGASLTQGTVIFADETGYVRRIDMQALQDCAEEAGTQAFVERIPGAFVARGQALMRAAAKVDDDRAAAFRRAFVIGTRRTFDEDPRFGLIVLSEIASRALSPAVNDPGTAIDILGRHVRILSRWSEDSEAEVLFKNVFVPPIRVEDVMEDVFRPIARDGAGLVEVQVRLQKALAALTAVAPAVFADPAERMAREALTRAEAAAPTPLDLADIRAAALPGVTGADTPEAGANPSP